ncbi:hypothetical protein BS17DRAFT_876943 [Gyrodon lividus]|nr:hypothetical protein BS17DRAFT_876943 [Gyrodon lividus]
MDTMTPGPQGQRMSLPHTNQFNLSAASHHQGRSSSMLFGDHRSQQLCLENSPSPTLIAPNHTPLLEYSQGYSVPHTPHMPHQNPMAYHNALVQNEMLATHLVQQTLQLLLEEVQKVNQRISSVESMNNTILANQQALTNCVQSMEDAIRHIKETVVALAEKPHKANSSKNISNQHPKLKAIIHLLFFELCGISPTEEQSQRLELLSSFPTLALKEAVTTIAGKTVWRPHWKEPITTKASRIKGSGKIDNADYDPKVILMMTKDYFCNTADQVKKHTDPEKFD